MGVTCKHCDIGFKELEHHGCGIHRGPGAHPPQILRAHGLLKEGKFMACTIAFSPLCLPREAAPDGEIALACSPLWSVGLMLTGASINSFSI